VAYIYRGGVTYVQVKRLVAAPAALPAPGPAAQSAAQSAAESAAEPAAEPAAELAPARPLPDVGVLLDEAFGPEPTP